jgi:tryptophan synthase alpha chain
MKRYNGIYLMGNYPDRDTFTEGALAGLSFFDFLEIGVPFSDPVSDGPVIATAAHRAIGLGVTPDDVFESARRIAERAPSGKDIYLMLYTNHVYTMGPDAFARRCADCGIRGAIIPDTPFAESARFKVPFERNGIHFVHFITPENTDVQVREIAQAASGFLYAVSMRGITGGSLALDADMQRKIGIAREHANVPVVLGFGVRSAGDAKEALRHADGFIMGTIMVELINSEGSAGIRKLAGNLDDELQVPAQQPR